MSSLILKDRSTFQVYCIKKILCGELEPDRFIFKRVKNLSVKITLFALRENDNPEQQEFLKI